MKELLNKPDLWDNLKAETRPIVLYGIGAGAQKIFDNCTRMGISINGVFASESYNGNAVFNRLKVTTLSALEGALGESLVVLLAFGTTNKEVLDYLDVIREKHSLYVPDVPVADNGLFDREFFASNFNDIDRVYRLLSDDLSRQTYRDIISFKLSGNPDYLMSHWVTREKMLELFCWNKNQVFVDAGAFRGDTIEEFVKQTGGNYKKIYALEPDSKNYLKLKANLNSMPCITTLNVAAWNTEEMLHFSSRSSRSGRVETGTPNTRAVSIDSLLPNRHADYIKYDVEGAEKQALQGSEKTIKHSYPNLLVSIYHRPEDIFALPLQVLSIAPDYKLYIRRNFGLPAWDINLIAIKEN